MAVNINNRVELFTFAMNGDEWTVYLVDIIDENSNIYGQTIYSTNTVLLRRLPYNLMRKTFIHEFTHVWLFETGRDPDVERRFGDEEVCCMYSHMFDNLTNIMEMFENAILKED